MAAPPSSNTNWGQVAIAGAVLGGIYLVTKAFEEPQPGGDVDPAGEDPRPATFSQTTAANYAQVIFEAVWGPGFQYWERDRDFANALMKCKVTNDVRLLMNAYGDKGILTYQYTLAQTVTKYLDNDYKDAVNLDYREKNIVFQWV